MLRSRFSAALTACLLVLCLAPAPAAAGGTASPLQEWKFKSTGIPANDAVYDARRGTFLVTVTARHSSLGNMLVEMNPRTGAIGRRVFVGSDPQTVVVTDDASTAYVALGDANRVVRIDLATFTLAGSFSTGWTRENGPRWVEEMEPLPGRNDGVAVSLRPETGLPRYEGVFVFVNGQELPDNTGLGNSSRIEFTGPGRLLSLDDDFDDPIRTLQVDDNGVRVVAKDFTAISGSSKEIEFSDGRLYHPSGMVIDAETFEPVRDYHSEFMMTVEPNPEIDRVAFLDSQEVLHLYEHDSGLFVGSKRFPEIPSEHLSLVSSADGYAVVSREAVFLLGPAVVPGGVVTPPATSSFLGGLRPLDVGIPANDAVFDKQRNRLYVTVPDGQSEHANELLALDPETGEVLESLPVGRQPDRLALTEDLTGLYVTVRSTREVNRVDLDTFLVTREFLLHDEPLVAVDLEVMPGAGETVAASLTRPNLPVGQGSVGVAFYRDGERLPEMAVPGQFKGADQIEVFDSSTLFGTPAKVYDIFEIEAHDDGGHVVKTTASVFPQSTGRMQITGGLLYSAAGMVADPAGPERLGAYHPFSDPWNTSRDVRAIEVVPEWSRTFIAASDGHVEEFDLNEFRLLGALSGPDMGFGPSTLVATRSGLALAGSNLVLFVPKGAPPPPPETTQQALAWGFNGFGALGAEGPGTTPVSPSGLANVSQVAAGTFHSLALKSDGTVWAWGFNGFGALGDGTATDRHTPVQVPGLSGIVEVAAGMFHSTALKADGTVWAWGWNGFGQLGDGSTADSFAPVKVSGLAGVASVSAGALHSLARKSDGTVWGWGYNGFGALGDGTTRDRHRPVQAAGLQNVTGVSAGGFHSAASDNTGRVWTWGWNAFGQLGEGSTVDKKVPVRLVDRGLVTISAGYLHTVAISVHGLMYAWGWNGYGQVGDGTRVDRHSPKLISTNELASASAGMFHNVAVTELGYVLQWGWNGVRQLATDTAEDSLYPRGAARAGRMTQASAGGLHTLGVVRP